MKCWGNQAHRKPSDRQLRQQRYLEAFNLAPEEREYIERSPQIEKPCDPRALCGLPEPAPDDYEPRDTTALLDRLRKAIARLTPRQQQIVALYMEGFTQKQIAERLGVTQGAICLMWQGQGGVTKSGIVGALKRYLSPCEECGADIDIRGHLMLCAQCMERRRDSGYRVRLPKTPKTPQAHRECCGQVLKGKNKYCEECKRKRNSERNIQRYYARKEVSQEG